MIGNTIHKIDNDIDMGQIIYQQLTPILQHYSLRQLSNIHYNNEIFLLSNFFKFLKKKKFTNFNLKKKINNKRMSIEKENYIISNYSIIKKKIKIKQDKFYEFL